MEERKIKLDVDELSYIRIKGGTRLEGVVSPDGAKNSALIQLASLVLVDGNFVTLKNLPLISDVYDSIEMINETGLKTKLVNNEVTVMGDASTFEFSAYYGSKIRASLAFLGSVLSKFGQVKLPLPGGDKIGERPIDIHVDVLEAFDIEVSIKNGFVLAEARTFPLKGSSVFLRFPSVLATVNGILLGVLAEGKTVLNNVAKEPEIVDLTNLLTKMGARISGVGTDRITIVGVTKLNSTTHEVMPDRLEAAALMMSIVMTEGKGTVENTIPEHNIPLIETLRRCGIEVVIDGDKVHIDAVNFNKGFQVETRPFPGLATDVQPLITPLGLKCPEESVITDNIFQERFSHVDELRKMGAQIDRFNNTIHIKPNHMLSGASVEGGDIRTVVTLINAALSIDDDSKVYGVEHLNRGHSKFIEKLKLLKADIEIIN